MKLPTIVSADWLFQNSGRPDLVILDATLAKPQSAKGDTHDSSLQIKNARFFDIDHSFSDTSTDLPHMMCDKTQFEREAQKLGINEDSLVVVYDQHGVYSSPRAWWMMKSMGHDRVAVLDGGLPGWLSKDYPTETSKTIETKAGNFGASPKDRCFVDAAFVLEHINDPNVLVLDARSKGRFDGTEPEPRTGLRSGHIPNAESLPFTNVIDGHTIRQENELKAIFEGLDLTGKKLVFSCGSGLTACIILLAAHIVGCKDLSVYDGSWTEWGQSCDLPVKS